MTIVLIRAFFTAAILLLVIIIYDRKLLKIKFRDLWIFAGMGILSIVLFNYCYFTAVSLMSLSTAAILLYTSPVFVMIFSAIIFKEKITLKKVFAMLISIIGLILVTDVLNGSSVISLNGMIYGIISAIGYALYSIFSRFALNRGYHPLTTTVWAFIFAAVCSAFMADIPSCINMFSSVPSIVFFTIVFSVITSILPYTLYAFGLKGTENSTAAVLASIEPVSATVFGIFFYGEYPSLSAIIGILLVLSALVLCIDKHKQ